jgi:hypothetical protein
VDPSAPVPAVVGAMPPMDVLAGGGGRAQVRFMFPVGPTGNPDNTGTRRISAQ